MDASPDLLKLLLLVHGSTGLETRRVLWCDNGLVKTVVYRKVTNL